MDRTRDAVPNTRNTITPESEAHWLAMREENLNSTDIAALFGCSPYQTAFELWHRKAGNVASDFKDNERMQWGRRLEAIVAQGICEDNGWTATPFKEYMNMPALRLGSSFDFIAHDALSNESILEIKCVDFFAFKDGWIIDGDNIEAPPHIELQVQHQMLVSGIHSAKIGVLIGGNRVMLIEREADYKIHGLIISKAAAFWQSIEAGTPPDPDYTADAKTIIALNSNVREGAFIDASDDEKIAQAIIDYQHVSSECTAMDKLKDAKKAELLELIGDAEKVVAGKYSLSAGLVKDTAGTTITADMVGTIIGGRKGYRMCKVSVKKDKAA
jgi:putative phage-type endonuclease